VGLKLNGTHQLLVYSDDVNLLDDNIDIIKKNIQTLIVNTEKNSYMLLSRRQNAGQNHDIKAANRYSENVAQFKYLRRTVKKIKT
jgi:hypothetical protein